jgi:hypothetical protein
MRGAGESCAHRGSGFHQGIAAGLQPPSIQRDRTPAAHVATRILRTEAQAAQARAAGPGARHRHAGRARRDAAARPGLSCRGYRPIPNGCERNAAGRPVVRFTDLRSLDRLPPTLRQTADILRRSDAERPDYEGLSRWTRRPPARTDVTQWYDATSQPRRDPRSRTPGDAPAGLDQVLARVAAVSRALREVLMQPNCRPGPMVTVRSADGNPNSR